MFTTITGSGFNATPLAEYSGDIEGGAFSWSTANLIGAELFFLSSTISSGLARPIRPRATYRGAFISPWRCFVSRRSNFKKNRSLLRDKIRATISEHAQFSSSRGHHVSPLERKSSGVVRVSGHRFTGGGGNVRVLLEEEKSSWKGEFSRWKREFWRDSRLVSYPVGF